MDRRWCICCPKSYLSQEGSSLEGARNCWIRFWTVVSIRSQDLIKNIIWNIVLHASHATVATLFGSNRSRLCLPISLPLRDGCSVHEGSTQEKDSCEDGCCKSSHVLCSPKPASRTEAFHFQIDPAPCSQEGWSTTFHCRHLQSRHNLPRWQRPTRQTLRKQQDDEEGGQGYRVNLFESATSRTWGRLTSRAQSFATEASEEGEQAHDNSPTGSEGLHPSKEIEQKRPWPFPEVEADRFLSEA